MVGDGAPVRTGPLRQPRWSDPMSGASSRQPRGRGQADGADGDAEGEQAHDPAALAIPLDAVSIHIPERVARSEQSGHRSYLHLGRSDPRSGRSRVLRARGSSSSRPVARTRQRDLWPMTLASDTGGRRSCEDRIPHRSILDLGRNGDPGHSRSVPMLVRGHRGPITTAPVPRSASAPVSRAGPG